MIKQSIAIYDPSDPVEKAIQNAFHESTGRWLSSPECQLAAQAISDLKLFDDEWLENADLLDHRISYFFASHMSQKKDTMVFVTHLLYLRDILENESIDGFVHYPVTFMTTPLAYYLFREYPVHILVDVSKMKELNPGMKFLEIGGLIISTEDVCVNDEAIIQVMDRTEDGGGTVLKAAAVEVKPGIFLMGDEDRNMNPGLRVWDKSKMVSGTICEIEPGETGLIKVEQEGGHIVTISKIDFDSRFSQRVEI